mmetsp:Transcript_33505/g.106932  ORF Transcript_33505/g.106932 Transcript_33505/m.106932 type:complete len:460 (-) Transcript_33505:164-1543(-)
MSVSSSKSAPRPAETSTSSALAARAAPAAPAPLSKEKVAARLETELEEYFNLGQVEELLLNLKELREKARLPKGEPSLGFLFLKEGIAKAIEAKDAARVRECMAKSIGPLHREKLLAPAEVRKYFTDMLEFIEDEAIDVPSIGAIFANYIAAAIADDVLPLGFLATAFNHLADSHVSTLKQSAMLGATLAKLCERAGAERGRALYAEAKDFDLAALAGGSEAAVELLEGAGVAALDPALTQQVTADKEAASLAAEAATREALCARVDTYVDERLASEGAFAALDKPKEGEKPEAPATAVAAGLWVGNELVGSGLANDLQTRKQLMRAMMRKMLTYAPRTAEGQPCPKTIERGLKRWTSMIQVVSRPDSEQPLDAQAAAHALFEVQGFCSEHGFPEGLLKKIYYALYDADVINESAFAIWKDTDPDAEPTPNKLKALVQANEFLTWLDSATQESGPSDDD